MNTFAAAVLLVFSGGFAVLVIVFVVEVLAAILSASEILVNDREAARPLVAVLVPAHNEGEGVRRTIESILGELSPRDRLLVVADNCEDDTAAIARAAGAEVIERQDTDRRGKGYALDFGIRHLSANPSEVVIIIDADCQVSRGAVAQLAVSCRSTGRPIQALDLMLAPDSGANDHRFAEFAWRVKNEVRPRGLQALRLPCQLMGTGMAFPWDLLRRAKLATGQIVEDLELGLELAGMGKAAHFCPSARVTSYFPSSAEAAAAQRQRWEHGHIGIILFTLPRRLVTAIRTGNFQLLVLTLDAAVPPIVLLGLALLLCFAIAGVASFCFGVNVLAFIIGGISLTLYGVGIAMCWLGWGREILPGRSLLAAPAYVLRKLPLYGRVLIGRSSQAWTRTDRAGPRSSVEPD